MAYNPQEIEKKWQKHWQNEPDAVTLSDHKKTKFYCLDMFPYPSGAGIHMGHVKNYVFSDIYARSKWLQGYNVLHPMGWDAFGLPAENAAIKRGVHPQKSTQQSITTFTKQLKGLGLFYDWTKEINTTDPEYYKWTQWIFLKMYNADLAYCANKPINWCPSCKTGLANEEVVNGGCERCGTKVEQKQIPQWVLKITQYAQKLIDGLQDLDWPEKVKQMQRNWIGKSEGALVTFTAKDHHGKPVDIEIFTTRPDTLLGVTYLVVAPDAPIVQDIIAPQHVDAVRTYQEHVKKMSPFDRQLDREKTGVFTGTYAQHPITGKDIPVWLASYVLSDYGTGAVMAVPAHDARDFEFAGKYDLPIIQVIESPEVTRDASGKLTAAYEGDGLLINSGQFNGVDSKKAIEEITKLLTAKGKGKHHIQYKLRDWIFSRQRYWGEPIPLIHCPTCGIVPVPEKDLPVLLPDVERYEPTGTGQSPLAAIESWVNVACPRCKGPGKRETNTMPQWAGSCWYFLRYPNPRLKDKAFDVEDMSYWMPVDLYIGGIEHAILHLLYARFYIKVLADLGYLSFNEPFKKLYNQGMILKFSEKSGQVEKMSKSKGNVVNPDDIAAAYGVDALRLYIMFMGPVEMDCEWQENGLEGMKRFLNRLWTYLTTQGTILADTAAEDAQITARVQLFLMEFQDRITHFKPNTAISAMMELLNDLMGKQAPLRSSSYAGQAKISKKSAESMLVSLSVIAPHIACELLEQLLHKKLRDCSWPTCDKSALQAQPVVIAIQVNGKTRCTISVAKGTDKKTIENQARVAANKWLAQATIKKVIVVPDRLINFVI